MTWAGRQKTDWSLTRLCVNSTSLSNSGKHSISMPTYNRGTRGMRMSSIGKVARFTTILNLVKPTMKLRNWVKIWPSTNVNCHICESQFV